MSNTTRNHRRLPGVQLHGAPFRMVERVAAKLKPNLVLVATAVKASLFLFQVINVNPELLAVVEHGSLGSAFPGHASKIVEPSDLLDGATAARDGADQSGGVALNPNVGLRIPESDMLEGAAVFRFLSPVAVPRERFRWADFELGLHNGLFGIDSQVHQLSGSDAKAQALFLPGGSMRDGRRHQDQFARFDFHNATFAFDLRTAAELEINQIMIRRPGQLLLDSVDVFSRYRKLSPSQTIARVQLAERGALRSKSNGRIFGTISVPCGRCR